jgi:hypothetical protein
MEPERAEFPHRDEAVKTAGNQAVFLLPHGSNRGLASHLSATIIHLKTLPTISALDQPRRVLTFLNILFSHGIIHLHAFPKVRTLRNEFLVNRMFLIHILIGFVLENKCDGKAVRVVNYGAARFGWHANVSLPNFADARQHLQSGVQRILGRLAVLVFQPKIDSVDKSGFAVFHGFGCFALGNSRKGRATDE